MTASKSTHEWNNLPSLHRHLVTQINGMSYSESNNAHGNIVMGASVSGGHPHIQLANL